MKKVFGIAAVVLSLSVFAFADVSGLPSRVFFDHQIPPVSELPINLNTTFWVIYEIDFPE